MIKEVSNLEKVSIIIPVFNGANYLNEAIQSALGQTYKNIEVIVVNDGSDDDGATRKIALTYGNKITYYEKTNGGVGSALNLGIRRMTGSYFSWLSHDDRYKPNKIFDQMKLLSTMSNKQTIVYGGYQLINEKGICYEEVNPYRSYSADKLCIPMFPLFKGLVNGCTLLIHKCHFTRVGLFDESLKTTQDFDMWFRMFRNAQIICQNEINVQTRIHEQRGSIQIRNHNQEANEEWIRKMNRMTREEMIAVGGSVEGFYKEIMSTLHCFEEYKEAWLEAERMYNILKQEKRETYKVSIVIPFYNRIPLVIQSLTSAMIQTYKEIEICLVDDGSTEDLTALMKIINQDKRIKYIRQQHLGVAVARNRGIREATGEYIAFLDSDDLFTKDKIEKQLNFMCQNKYVFSHTSYERMSESAIPLQKWDSGKMKGRVYPDIVKMCLVATPTVMVKKSILANIGFKENITVSEDIILWIDLAAKYELGGIEEYLSYVRIGEQTTWKDPYKVRKGYLNVLEHLLENKLYVKDKQLIESYLINFSYLFKLEQLED